MGRISWGWLFAGIVVGFLLRHVLSGRTAATTS